MKENSVLQIGGKNFSNRLMVGTGKYSSSKIMIESLSNSETEIVTVAVRRVQKNQKDENFNFIGTFAIKINNSNQYFFNELSNLSLRKGVPPEYGILNYSGTKNITFSESGISQEQPMAINFPGKDTEKYAFIPRQINPKNKESSYFLIINEKATNLMVGLVK